MNFNSSPESRRSQHRFTSGLIIALLGFITLSSACSVGAGEARNEIVRGTATAIANSSDPLLDSANIQWGLDSIIGLHPLDIAGTLTATVIDTGYEDLDNNANTPDEPIALILTAAHAGFSVGESAELKTDGYTVKGTALDVQRVGGEPNAKGDAPILAKMALDALDPNYSIILSHDHDLELSVPQIAPQAVVSCGFDYAVSPQTYSARELFCDSGTTGELFFGFLEVIDTVASLGHSGGPLFNENGEIIGITSDTPPNSNKTSVYFSTLGADASTTAEAMMINSH